MNSSLTISDALLLLFLCWGERVGLNVYAANTVFVLAWQVSIPPEALQPLWTNSYRKSWGMKLHSSSSAEDLLQVIS